MKGMLKHNWRWLLILSCLPLFSHKAAANLPVAVMALLGLAQLIRTPKDILADHGVQFMSAVFLCFEVPILLSLPDSVNLERAVETALVDLRFWFAGVFVVLTLGSAEARRKLLLGSGIVVAVWCVDASIQYLFGRGVFGLPTVEGRVTGVFDRFRLGFVLATVSPLLFELVRRHGGNHRWLWALPPMLLMVILANGNRMGWLLIGVSMMVYGAYVLLGMQRRHRAIMLISSVFAIAVAVWVTSINEAGRARLEQTSGVFGNYQAMDEATSYRLSVWAPAVRVAMDHWINGIGPRGFRYVFGEYAEEGNYFFDSGIAPTHPHQLLLEIAVETGVVGLVGYALMWLLLVVRLTRVSRTGRAEVLPWLFASILAWFPLNAHMAVYGSYWSSIAWWLLLVAMGVLAATGQACSSVTKKAVLQ